jgi:hypothetical protein
MTTINLHQNQNENGSNMLVSSRSGGMIFSLFILLSVGLSYVGLKYYIPTVDDKNIALDAAIKSQNDQLVGLKSLEKVVDSQKRLIEIKNNLQFSADGNVGRVGMTNILDDLSSELSPAVIVSDFEYKNNEVTVTFESNSFSDVAKQVSNFKKSEHFSGAYLATISRKDNVITCSVGMRVANTIVKK